MSPSFNDNENLLYSIFIYILFVCIPLCLLFGLLGAPLDEAEDVDPEEAAVQYSTVQYSTVQYSTCRCPRRGRGGWRAPTGS